MPYTHALAIQSESVLSVWLLKNRINRDILMKGSRCLRCCMWNWLERNECWIFFRFDPHCAYPLGENAIEKMPNPWKQSISIQHSQNEAPQCLRKYQITSHYQKCHIFGPVSDRTFSLESPIDIRLLERKRSMVWLSLIMILGTKSD